MTFADVTTSVIEATQPVCAECTPIVAQRAHGYAAWIGIGRLSVAEAAVELGHYARTICNHLGAQALLPSV